MYVLVISHHIRNWTLPSTGYLWQHIKLADMSNRFLSVCYSSIKKPWPLQIVKGSASRPLIKGMWPHFTCLSIFTLASCLFSTTRYSLNWPNSYLFSFFFAIMDGTWQQVLLSCHLSQCLKWVESVTWKHCGTLTGRTTRDNHQNPSIFK